MAVPPWSPRRVTRVIKGWRQLRTWLLVAVGDRLLPRSLDCDPFSSSWKKATWY